MRDTVTGTLVMIATLAALPAAAQGIDVSAGAAVTTNYISNGLSLSNDHPVVQGYFEAEGASGFYAGIWASTLANTGDSVEADLYLGYRGQTPGHLSYDANYTRYVYIGSGDCCGEIGLSLGVPVSGNVTAKGALKYDPKAKTLTTSLTGEVALTDAVGLSATLGHSEANGNTFASFDASYALNDKLSVKAGIADTSTSSLVAALTLSFDTSFSGQ